MSSQVTIQPTEFVNHSQGRKTYGFRIYDDYAQTYDNTWESIPDDDMEILALVMDSDDDVVCEMLSFLQEHSKSLNIGDNWYPWDEIKHLWEDNEKE